MKVRQSVPVTSALGDSNNLATFDGETKWREGEWA